MSKVWFLTGTSKGFGRVWAEAALERGDRPADTARDASTLDGLVGRYGDLVPPLALDVTDKAAVGAAVDEPPLRMLLGAHPFGVITEEYPRPLREWEDWQDGAASAQGDRVSA